LDALEASLAVKNVQQVFSSLYGFETMELELPSSSQLRPPERLILGAHDKARRQLGDNGLILFYYCGHSTEFNGDTIFHAEREIEAGYDTKLPFPIARN
jgi:hypothetical protein